jgi:F0F1-type ATP synthase assembly protein I
MPGESTISAIRERIAALETWRDEHKAQHSQEVQKQQNSVSQKFVIIAAVIGVVGAVIGGAIGALITHLLSSSSN